MPEKAAYCREQAELARRAALTLPMGDEIRQGLERAEQAFLALAQTFDAAGASIAQQDIDEAAELLGAFIARAEQTRPRGSPAGGLDGAENR